MRMSIAFVAAGVVGIAALAVIGVLSQARASEQTVEWSEPEDGIQFDVYPSQLIISSKR
jgi:hypothetical protein